MRNVLVLATGNPKKARELAAIAGDDYVVKTMAELGVAVDVDENAPDFLGNAALKCDAVFSRAMSHPDVASIAAVLADDSGICIDALGGKPGIRSARFAADHDAGQGDADNNALALDMMKKVEDASRGARFVCAVVLKTLPDAQVFRAEGAVYGRLARHERGSGGFGYDPLFIPDAYPERRMAELSSAQKHAISHRGQALRAVMKAAQSALAQ